MVSKSSGKKFDTSPLGTTNNKGNTDNIGAPFFIGEK
jgi:hypothetical protein